VTSVLWIVGLVVGALCLDRILLGMESRGWIYYRRTKPGRGASTYHLLEWNAVLDPTMRQVLEERTREERVEEESGVPPGPDDRSGSPEETEESGAGDPKRPRGGDRP
jgi:hypothetical protein